jgi:hypothetical protein
MRLKLEVKISGFPNDDDLDFGDYLVDDEFRYLRWKKPNENFSRVDKYSVIRYWNENEEQLREMLFYPSKFGMNEIKEYLNYTPIDGNKNNTHLIKRLYQLIAYGNAQWNTDVYAPIERKKSKRLSLTPIQSTTTRLKLTPKPIQRFKLKATK